MDRQITVTTTRSEQDGSLWIDLHYVYVGYEDNFNDTLMLSEDEARELIADLQKALGDG